MAERKLIDGVTISWSRQLIRDIKGGSEWACAYQAMASLEEFALAKAEVARPAQMLAAQFGQMDQADAIANMLATVALSAKPEQKVD